MNSIQLAKHHLDTQSREIAEMKARTEPFETKVAGISLLVFPKVYPGGIDSVLMCKVIGSVRGKTVLDLCTGTGVIALKAALSGAKEVIGVDLNPESVKNAIANKTKFGLKHIEFLEGSLFKPVLSKKFDLITINPPYTGKKPADKTEICFWDEDNLTTKKFFQEYKQFLNPGGEAYLAWADFGSLELLKVLAQQNNVSLKQVASKATSSGFATFFIYKLIAG